MIMMIKIKITIIIIITGVAIAGDRNVIKKETDKILKYKDLTIEIECMWNVKTKAIPEITGGNGTVSEPFREYLSNVEGKHEIKGLRKQPYWALHVLWKALV
jgi:hypothetical protein